MISGKRKRDFPSGLYPAELQSQGSVGRAFTYQHLAFGSNAASHGKDREVILRRIPDSHCATNKSRWDDSEGHYIIVDDTDITPRCKQAYHQAVAWLIDQIKKLLGQGTFGKVVQAWDRSYHKFVAIKIIRAVQKYRDASMIELRVLRTLYEHDPHNYKSEDLSWTSWLTT